jgi:CBS domain-containing protein
VAIAGFARGEEGNMKVFAAMTRDVDVVSPGVSVRAAERMMTRAHIRHLPVVAGGRLVGILSDRDVLRWIREAEDRTCGEVMTAAPITCSGSTPVGRVAEMMLTHKIDSIPILDDDGALIGLVTSSDLLSLLVDRDQTQSLPFDYRLRMLDGDVIGAVA